MNGKVKMFNSERVDIPPKVVAEIQRKLEDIFGSGNAVIIGGRAVNIWCYNNTRGTRDIDVVLGIDPSNIPDVVEKLAKAGFFVNMRNNEKINNVEYMDWKGGIKIDFYYSKPIGGVEISDIIDTAEERPLTKHETAKVVNPALLIMMKLIAGRDKDRQDIANIMSSLYKRDIDIFMAEENEIISRYFKDQKSKRRFGEIIDFVVKDVDFSSNFRNY